MTGADSSARAVQEKIDALQAELHSSVHKLVVNNNMKTNACYMDRHKVIMQAIHDGKLPRTFWADAIVATLETPDGVEDKGRLLGEYDATLLKQYLREMKVTHTEKGFKVALVFDPNPFFEETELWGEDLQLQRGDDDDDDEEDEEVCRFSGVTWKPGHGPKEEEEEDDGGDNNNDGKSDDGAGGGNGAGGKRDRSVPTTQGWSFLDVFSKMLPHPEDEEFDEENDDDDELADAVEKWEEEMEDRKDLLMTLVEDVWMDPIASFKKGMDGGKGGRVEMQMQQESDASTKKRVRTE